MLFTGGKAWPVCQSLVHLKWNRLLHAADDQSARRTSETPQHVDRREKRHSATAWQHVTGTVHILPFSFNINDLQFDIPARNNSCTGGDFIAIFIRIYKYTTYCINTPHHEVTCTGRQENLHYSVQEIKIPHRFFLLIKFPVPAACFGNSVMACFLILVKQPCLDVLSSPPRFLFVCFILTPSFGRITESLVLLSLAACYFISAAVWWNLAGLHSLFAGNHTVILACATLMYQGKTPFSKEPRNFLHSWQTNAGSSVTKRNSRIPTWSTVFFGGVFLCTHIFLWGHTAEFVKALQQV